jgi:hypothetical protein
MTRTSILAGHVSDRATDLPSWSWGSIPFARSNRESSGQNHNRWTSGKRVQALAGRFAPHRPLTGHQLAWILAHASRTEQNRNVPRCACMARKSRIAALLAMCLMGIFLSACGSTTNPVLTRADLTGRWVSPNDGSLRFESNQKVVADHLRNPFFGSAQCSGAGTWQFLNAQGDSSPNFTSYNSGNQVGILEIRYTGSKAGGSTEGFGCMPFSLITWKTDGTLGLCMDFDPDSPCTGQVYVKWEQR